VLAGQLLYHLSHTSSLTSKDVFRSHSAVRYLDLEEERPRLSCATDLSSDACSARYQLWGSSYPVNPVVLSWEVQPTPLPHRSLPHMADGD
jgi:hypothetical protein